MKDSALRILVTGGAGFIGSALVRHLIQHTPHLVLNVDKLTYAGDLRSLSEIAENARYQFLQADICDAEAMGEALAAFGPDVVMHLAAESHVDRSIESPAPFIQTNIVGTYVLLEALRKYAKKWESEKRGKILFIHASTDEVFGEFRSTVRAFENSPYNPSSPYAAAKAAADHLVRAWRRTYGIPVVVTHSANAYGPYQQPEKLIPRLIINALKGEMLPLYGDGRQVRDWVHVEDHVRALIRVLEAGQEGETYLVSARCERTNLGVAEQICGLLDRLRPRANGRPYRELIGFVADRPGHDVRYGIDPAKIERELGWKAATQFDSGLEATVRWYLENEWWWHEKGGAS